MLFASPRGLTVVLMVEQQDTSNESNYDTKDFMI